MNSGPGLESPIAATLKLASHEASGTPRLWSLNILYTQPMGGLRLSGTSVCAGSSLAPKGCECRSCQDSHPAQAGPEPLSLELLLPPSPFLHHFCFHSNSTFVVFHCAWSLCALCAALQA